VHGRAVVRDGVLESTRVPEMLATHERLATAMQRG